MKTKVVQFISLGPSGSECPPEIPEGVERWGIQYTWKFFEIDRAFVMDEENWVVPKNHSFEVPIDIEQEMRDAKVPIYVSKKWKNVSNTIEYPIDKMREHFKTSYFMNSMAYMFALAIYEGFERIETYGIDLRYYTALKGPMKYERNWLDETHCCEFWAGMSKGRGIEVVVTKYSSLMKPKYPGDPSLYGYELSPELERQRKGILEMRKKVQQKLEPKRLAIFKRPEGMSNAEMERQIAVGALKPKAHVEAKEWSDVIVQPEEISKGMGNKGVAKGERD